MKKPPNGTKYMSEARAAEYFGISNWAMQTLRRKKIGPPFTQLSKTLIRYHIDDLDIFIGMRRVDHKKMVEFTYHEKEANTTK